MNDVKMDLYIGESIRQIRNRTNGTTIPSRRWKRWRTLNRLIATVEISKRKAVNKLYVL